MSAVSLASFAVPARATTYTIDDAASPISATFTVGTGTSADGRIAVTVKPDSTPTWNQGTAGGGSSFSGGSLLSQASTKVVWQNATIGSTLFNVTVELVAPYSNGDLRVTLSPSSSNPSSTLSGTVAYPYPFYTSNGAGNAIVPINAGHVVPTSVTSFASDVVGPIQFPGAMEFCGGTDGNTNTENAAAWIGIFETPDDAYLNVTTTTVVGSTAFLGTGVNWLGSNNNASNTTNLVSYPRSIRYNFLPTGGYVAVAKKFRAYANSQGWLKTLAEKVTEFPGTTEADNPVLQAIGAPIIYLWGDGRNTAMLDALAAANVSKAMLQVSVNQVDQNGTFDTSWFDSVHSKNASAGTSYLAGIYDIYTTAQGSSTTNYSGFFYRWPTQATDGTWAWVNTPGGSPEQGQGGVGYNICMTNQENFANGTRLTYHINEFDYDATFFDVHLAQGLRECYNSSHLLSRSGDRATRVLMLADAYNNSLKNLLPGTERARSWAIPYLIWGEGVQHLGPINEQGIVGTSDLGPWSGNSYPDITVNMKDLSTSQTKMEALMSDGYQVPLWDLVFHDCVLTTLHWERAQDKFLYVWDHADQAAILRGQTALLNLTYQGASDSGGDNPGYVTDNNGAKWSMRWLDTTNDPTNRVKQRVLKTISNVCGWHEQVGLLEMTDHQWLTTDRTVQKTEFSANGGTSGYGVVVNYGTYNYANNKFGPATTSTSWTGSPHAGVASITVPYPSATSPGFVTYTWGSSQVAAPTFNPVAGTYSTAQNVTITSSTSGATISYTTDGSMPSQSHGTIYAGAVNIGVTATLKAIAYKSGMTDSGITSGVYTISGGNTAPVANNDSYSVNEDAVLNQGAAGVLLNDTDGQGDPLTVGTPRPVSGPTNGSLTLNANGSFTYTPAANFNGTDSFTYKAYDGALLSATAATVTLTVNSVNDVPSFTKGADQTVTAGTGTQTVAGWASTLNTGAANESGQTLNFIVSNNNNAIFSVQPAISATGTLTYTPVSSIASPGTATVTVQIHDNGGTANGGVDTSVAQTFTITVHPASTSLTVYSQGGANDGWILESGENTTAGGSIGGTNSTAGNALLMGDNNIREQYRSVISFDTSALPDGAVIDSVTIRLTRGSLTGTITSFGNLNVAIKSGAFANNVALGTNDFANATAPADLANVVSGGLTVPGANGGQTTGTLISGALQYVNKTGTTQFRIDFGTDDDNDGIPDNVGFFSGANGTVTNKPQLVITYH